MKVIAINGSPRKEGNTEIILNIIKEEFSKENIEMEIINIGADNIHGCISCWYCMEKQECIFKDDKVNETVKKIIEADGFILASPTYYGGIPGTMKSFLDRLFLSGMGKFRHKTAAAVSVARRAGEIDTLHQLLNFLHLSEVIIPPSQYWTSIYGMEKGEILNDKEGLQTIRKNIQGMIWIMKMINETKEKILPPKNENRIMTNFIKNF